MFDLVEFSRCLLLGFGELGAQLLFTQKAIGVGFLADFVGWADRGVERERLVESNAITTSTGASRSLRRVNTGGSRFSTILAFVRVAGYIEQAKCLLSRA